MVTRTQDLLWRATLDELRGLRRDVQDLAAALREGSARGAERLEAEASQVIVPPLPMLTTDDVARLLRTSRRVVYTMIGRGQVPGVVRLGRKILIRRDRLMRWLSKKGAPEMNP